MITSIDVEKWKPSDVNQWLRGLCDDASWLNADYVLNNNLTGRNLLMITTRELYGIGATKVDLQEQIFEAVEKLRHYSSNIQKETLQLSILKLACQSRSLQRQLVADRERAQCEDTGDKIITLTRDFQPKETKVTKQRVGLETLAYVSEIVKTVKDVSEIINRPPFTKYDEYRSMKSLILAMSIELTSTAQRDQFVVKPNDIIEKSAKALADYCDRIVYGTKDVLLIQPIQMRTVKVRKTINESNFGFTIKSPPGCVHIIDEITLLSAAKKTNQLAKGDEIVYVNQVIIGWTEKNVQNLLSQSAQLGDITLMVKKNPSDS